MLVAAADPLTAHALLPDRQMDGVYAAVVDRIDMWAGCRGRQRPAGTELEGAPEGMGFWVNLMTTRDAARVADPRPALRDVATPVLVLRGDCDYIAWEGAREYRDLLPNAVLLAVDDAGHAIHDDRPQLYGEAVLAFLTGAELPQQPYDGTSAQ